MRRLRDLLVILVLGVLAGCASLSGRDAPEVRVVGLEPLASEGLELRFALKIRLQNPNAAPIAFDGLALKLDLGGRGLASGVSDQKGEIPRFGETLLTVPVSISAFSALRQILGGVSRLDGSDGRSVLPYALSGKLGAASGSLNALRFVDKGELDLSRVPAQP